MLWKMAISNTIEKILRFKLGKLLACFCLLLLPASTLQAQYCASGATNTGDSNIGEVIFNTISNNSAGLCATYTDFTTLSTNVSIGNSYNLSVLSGTCGGDFTKHGAVYIDYNIDGDFDDPGEEVFTFGPNTTQQSFTTNITIPGTASIGTTRLRAVVNETGTPTNVAPCGTFTWGETEDYTVNIIPSAPNDMGVSSVNEPGSGCNLSATEQVEITVGNFGTNTQTSWTVSYRVNGGAVTTEPMSQSLASGATTTHTFATPANLAAAGTYVIEAWSSLAVDAFAGNDTSSTTVVAIPGVSVYPYVEDFESGNGGWISGGTNSSWDFGTPNKATIIGAASGVNAHVTGGLFAGDYNSNEQSFVIGPCFDFSTLQNPWISLSVWWHSENGWDGSNLQASTDFGATWVTIGAAFDPGNWYNTATTISNPGGDPNSWCGGSFSSGTGSNGWVTAAHRLDNLAGEQSVRLRITFGSDGSVQDDGFAFDDIRISEGPVVDLGADTLICNGDTLFLDAGSFAGYAWSTGDTTQIDTITSPGTIAIIATDTNGFFDLDTIIVAMSFPSVNIGPDSTICPEDSLILVADSNYTYLWQNNATTQSVVADTAGTYTVTVTDSVGCQDTDQMVLTLAVPPTLELGSDTTICTGNFVTLDAGGGPTGTLYSWNSGASTQLLVVTTGGSYAASVTTPGGCTAVDTIEVINNPSPGVSLGPDRVECGSYSLDAGPGGTSYSWSNGGNTQVITPGSGGTYEVTVSNSFGCVAIDTVVITAGTEPTVSLGPDDLVCNGQSLTLDAGNPGSTYFWSNTATTQTISVSSPGTYIVVVTNASGCNGSDTISINGSLLTVELGPSIDICGNGGVVLDAGNPGMTYSWSSGDNTQQIFASTPGTYTVTVTDGLGCDAIDNIVVGQQNGLAAGITAPGVATLFQSTQFSDATSPTPTSWAWDFGDGSTSTTQNPQHTYVAFGTYTVTLIASDGNCSDTTTTTVSVTEFVSVEEELGALVFELYPNPSNDIFHLHVELAKRKDMELQVMDLSGRTLYRAEQRSTQNFKEDIDLSTYPKGIYLMKIRSGEVEVYQKLVLQ